jgi:hypothetical protein
VGIVVVVVVVEVEVEVDMERILEIFFFGAVFNVF